MLPLLWFLYWPRLPVAGGDINNEHRMYDVAARGEPLDCKFVQVKVSG
jgi:hypothetical protein